MEDHTTKDQDRQEMAHEARDKELAKATVEGRVFVVTLHSRQTRSAEQARAFIWKDAATVVRAALNREQDTAG
jgi:hypothetical protein